MRAGLLLVEAMIAGCMRFWREPVGRTDGASDQSQREAQIGNVHHIWIIYMDFFWGSPAWASSRTTRSSISDPHTSSIPSMLRRTLVHLSEAPPVGANVISNTAAKEIAQHGHEMRAFPPFLAFCRLLSRRAARC